MKMEVTKTMNKMLPTTIRSKITIITVLITLSIAIFVASICFYIFQSFLRKSLVQSTEFNLQLIMDTINSDLDELIYITKWSSTNSLFVKYLESDTSNSDGLSLEAYERLKEEYQNSRSADYIKRLIISDDESKFLQVGNLNNLGLPYDDIKAKEQNFFTDLLKIENYYWIGIENDIFIPFGNEQIIPVVRPIYGTYENHIAGWVFLAISTDIITDNLRNYTIPKDVSIFFTIGDKTYLIEEDNTFIETNFDFVTVNLLSESTMNSSTIAQTVQDKEGNQRTLISCFSNIDNWYISQTLSESQFTDQKFVFYFLLVFIIFAVISLGIGLTIYINYTINIPIRGIQRKLNAISNGDFSKDDTIEWNHELGDIGKGINVLSKDVITLMDKRIESEKQQKDLEYKILQSQINPHFLHNTLNSIKWMATIQNATGISEMITALSRLLKSISNRTDQIIPIKEELELLENYIIIQQYRYGGTITINYNIQAEDLYDCSILRFSLQPIVENAIFHGIEAKGENGTILISLEKKENDILIKIRDNGVGMTKELIEKVLSRNEGAPSDLFQHIGINNVHRRIQYAFGDDYGIRIESEIGKYTEAYIRIPYIKGRENND